tara:strand:- start:743 stop:1354 length:612 start_codon:yes stop_codon:yes gene_type:complete
MSENYETNYKFVFDTETTGLPVREKRKKLNYNNLENFENSRIVSLSYLILNKNNEIVEKKTYYIKPDNFVVSQESINIHGLTDEFLNVNGTDIYNLFVILYNIFEKYKINLIISHNIDFDINILKSELLRYNQNELLINIEKITTYCTMLEAQKKMNVGKWPKLAEAYKYFYNDNIQNAHNAEYDTFYCYKVYLKTNNIELQN